MDSKVLRSQYWDRLQYEYEKYPADYLNACKKSVRRRIAELKHDTQVLEELLQELKNK